MIGVLSKIDQAGVVEEFFELFKTPWEFYRPGRSYEVVLATADRIPETDTRLLLVFGPAKKNVDATLGITAGTRRQGTLLDGRGGAFPVYGEFLTFEGSEGLPCVQAGAYTAGLQFSSADVTVLRLGYDLFEEVRFLLSTGQPVEHASVPALDIHIEMLREWILEAGVALLEIPPAPAQYSFAACLTHDIDFVGIRRHFLDHSMWGFVYRATVGGLRNALRGRLSFRNLFRSLRAVASLPFVYAGWAKDFWEPFEWYLKAEKDLPVTYFLIPFKGRSGEKVPGAHASRRATAYDVTDLPQWTRALLKEGCEIGVHGIDAWHDEGKAGEEMKRVESVTSESVAGIRMHWLLRDENTIQVLERAGYDYDSTSGYNETIGYRNGTSQVFRPLGAQTMLELPMHIQDGALFYPQRLDLSEFEAEKRCQVLIEHAGKSGGVVTLLWHDRSHGPERFWGGAYIRLLEALKPRKCWFGTAAQVVGWFRKRREVRFDTSGEAVRVQYECGEIKPPLKVRIHAPRAGCGASHAAEFTDISWDGKSVPDLEQQIATTFIRPAPPSAICTLS